MNEAVLVFFTDNPIFIHRTNFTLKLTVVKMSKLNFQHENMQRETGSISITKQVNKFDTQLLSEAYQNTYIKICIHLRGINTFSVLRLFVALTVYTKQHTLLWFTFDKHKFKLYATIFQHTANAVTIIHFGFFF